MSEIILSEQDADDFISIRAHRIAGRFRRQMLRVALRPAKLPVLEWRILISLARFGDCHLRWLTQNVEIDAAHASRAAASLEQKGLIQRRSDPVDQRRKLLSLTSAGIATFKDVWARAQGLTREFRAGFSDSDFAELKRLLDLAIVIVDRIDDLDTRKAQETVTA